MAVKALYEYHGELKDTLEDFGGVPLIYIGWDQHLMFCSAIALPLPFGTKFRDLPEKVLPGAYDQHPDFARIDWNAVEWLLDGEPLRPDWDATLEDNGFGHKSLLRLRTPGLTGIDGSAT